MASKNKNGNDVSAVDSGDDFFAGEEVVSSDLPRYAIGDPDTADDPSKTLKTVEGFYEDTIEESIEGKTRLAHRLLPRSPIDGNKRIILWGNYQLDAALPCLTKGTKVRITYKGTQPMRGGKTLKMIDVQFSAKAERRPHPFRQALTAQSESN